MSLSQSCLPKLLSAYSPTGLTRMAGRPCPRPRRKCSAPLLAQEPENKEKRLWDPTALPTVEWLLPLWVSVSVRNRELPQLRSGRQVVQGAACSSGWSLSL